jgi:hypothetical protein
MLTRSRPREGPISLIAPALVNEAAAGDFRRKIALATGPAEAGHQESTRNEGAEEERKSVLQGRSIYIWNLRNCEGAGTIDDIVAKAARHKLSSLWPKIADGNVRFANVEKPVADKMHELVTKARGAGISVLGYHVAWCANPRKAAAEVEFVKELVEEFELAGVVVDNEDGSKYFKGGSEEAHIYAAGLHTAMASLDRLVVMSSNDILSAHPGSQGRIIGSSANINAPQVYYGRSRSVQSRLSWALKENEPIVAPFYPIGAAFVSAASKQDGGCRSAQDCANRAAEFIAEVSALNQKDPAKYPGYGFWNWEEAPAEFWQVLERTPVFDGSERPELEAAIEVPVETVPAPLTILAYSATGFARVEGPIVERLQHFLDRSGFKVAQDGDFGDKTLAALHNWQSSMGLPQSNGLSSDDWQRLTSGPAPSIFDFCLQLTASFEGTGFNGAVGNFDGAGVTFGIIGFTATNGELSALVQRARQLDSGILDRTFGSLKQELIDGLGKPTAQARAEWGDSVSTGRNHYNLQSDWRRAFETFGQEPLVRALQIERAYSVYWKKARDLFARYGLASALDAALVYDIAVQNTLSGETDARIIARFKEGRLTPTQRRLIIVEEISDSSSPRWRNDVFARKSAIARGEGKSHGARYSLKAWGLDDRVISAADLNEPSRLGYSLPALTSELAKGVESVVAETFVCEGSGEEEAVVLELPTAKPQVDRLELTSHKEDRNGAKIDHVVIHYTTSRDIEGTINWFKDAPRGHRTSAHYIIDRDGALVQMVPDADAAWHSGSRAMNHHSIGIEHVAAAGDEIAPDQARTSLDLIRWLMAVYAIPIANVIPHCCVHTTSCCGDLFKAYGGGAGLNCSAQTRALHRWLHENGIGSG